MTPLVKLLSDWLSKNPQGRLTLARQLGYKTTSAIDMWVKRNRIPQWHIDRVLRVIAK